METQVDIQMPIRKGEFVIGDVIHRLLLQDVAFTFYVDAGEDFEFSPEQEQLLTLISTSGATIHPGPGTPLFHHLLLH